MATEKEQLRLQWARDFSKAVQADSWGQVVEAQEEYQRLAAVIAAKQGQSWVNSREKDAMFRIVQCLSSRAQSLRTMSENITCLDMKALESVFEVLFTGNEPDMFPIEAHKFSSARPVKPCTEGEIICGDADEPYSDWQLSQAVLKNVSGTVVCLRIDKIGLKDAQDYIDPFMTVIVADARTNILDTHDTPSAKEKRPTHCIFESQVYLNISLEDMQSQQAALFFEFKHYKPKKKKVSTRCWGFMELTELKRDEEMVLELYHKPTDLRKKKLKLHTEKQLYLHLFATFLNS